MRGEGARGRTHKNTKGKEGKRDGKEKGKEGVGEDRRGEAKGNGDKKKEDLIRGRKSEAGMVREDKASH